MKTGRVGKKSANGAGGSGSVKSSPVKMGAVKRQMEMVDLGCEGEGDVDLDGDEHAENGVKEEQREVGGLRAVESFLESDYV